MKNDINSRNRYQKHNLQRIRYEGNLNIIVQPVCDGANLGDPRWARLRFAERVDEVRVPRAEGCCRPGGH
jgi:hypothetical protein